MSKKKKSPKKTFKALAGGLKADSGLMPKRLAQASQEQLTEAVLAGLSAELVITIALHQGYLMQTFAGSPEQMKRSSAERSAMIRGILCDAILARTIEGGEFTHTGRLGMVSVVRPPPAQGAVVSSQGPRKLTAVPPSKIEVVPAAPTKEDPPADQ